MGYVHDNFSVVIPFTKFAHSAGTWTADRRFNVWYNRRTAADAAAVTMIPLVKCSSARWWAQGRHAQFR